MTVEAVYTRAVVIGRWMSVALAIAVISIMSGALGAWLVESKRVPAPVQEAPVAHVEDEAQVQRLVNELQTVKVQHAKELADYKRLTSNLKAQITALTPGVQRVEDQLKVLNEAAQRTTPPMTDRELEAKTKEVLGIVGKVVR